MKEKHTDSVQNRFTAYLVAAVGNTRKKYWERKYRLQGMDLAQEDLLERNYTDFDEQYRAYINGRDREILFARVYGELTFAELGERFHMEAKQAEMAYYYVLRKLRKEMNGKDGI